MGIKKPRACFLPVTMKLFWQLYPQLEKQTLTAMEQVVGNLRTEFEVQQQELVGDVAEAQEIVKKLAAENFDLLIVWENGYVASGIPLTVIETLKERPLALLVTQRDSAVPLNMDYARYMESTAITSAMELGGALARKNISYETFVGRLNERELYQRLAKYGKAAMVLHNMKRLQLGNIGYPYPNMLDISVDEASVSNLGIQMNRITLLEISQRLDAVTESSIDDFLQEISRDCDISRVSESDLRQSARLYRALEGIVLEKGLGALCVHDYECLSVVTKTVADFALSYLENRYGIATGVEGDVPNCISAFVARELSGISPMFVDWTMFDEQKNAVFLQHNGKADPSIVIKPVLSPSAEPFGGVEGDAVVIEASGKPGPVTMISMIYRPEGWIVFASEGEALEEPTRPCRLNQMTVRLEQPVKAFLEKICDEGIGHHLNVAYGSHTEEIAYFSKLAGIQFLNIE